jgi:NAD(P)-dependent dehydrogenase (short-subunit alcohol dehydrogenase family)
MNNLFSLKGKVVLVTGALGLLGSEFCKAFSEADASVVVTDLNDDKCSKYASQLGENHLGIGADITKKFDVEKLIKEVINHYGRVDVLVNNAAINDKYEEPNSAAELSRFENYPLELWQRSLEVNITGTFLTCQVVGSRMAEQGRGSIINIASTYGVTAPDQSLYKDPDGIQKFYKTAAYPVTKGAVISFTKFLAAYWGNRGVRVNSLSPGGVQNNQDKFFIDSYSARTPLGRMASVNDYNGALLFLAGDASAYMTGHNLIVDGGWTIW